MREAERVVEDDLAHADGGGVEAQRKPRADAQVLRVGASHKRVEGRVFDGEGYGQEYVEAAFEERACVGGAAFEGRGDDRGIERGGQIAGGFGGGGGFGVRIGGGEAFERGAGFGGAEEAEAERGGGGGHAQQRSAGSRIWDS
ncbi:MAG: hypothetical protein AMXMBFR7_00060 [Planctomycetota bacterium]